MHIPNVDIVASSSGTLRPEQLLYVFEVPDRTPTSGLRTQAIADEPRSIAFLTRLKTPHRPRHGTPRNRTPRIRNLVSYFLRGDVQARSAVQARQRAEGAR
jgi:hypothetical protein